MLRKTVITLTAVAVLGLGSGAMARGVGGGGGGGGHVAGFAGGGGWGGHVGGWGGGAAMHGAAMGHMMRGGPMVTTPMVGRSAMVTNFSRNHVAWGFRDHFHDHFHHRFHNRFFAFGFGGAYLYDYADNSCWTQVPTYHGWRWVYACGDYYNY
jgi:hypothetical protein